MLLNIKEYIGSLKSKVEELDNRNKILEHAYVRKDKKHHQDHPSGDQRLIISIEESTANLESRVVDLVVNATSGDSILGDLVVRILEFMKHQVEINLMSIDAQTHDMLHHSETILNRVVLRLRIQVRT